jgi:hypothetical protein
MPAELGGSKAKAEAEPVAKPTAEPVAEPAAKAAAEPVAKAVAEPAKAEATQKEATKAEAPPASGLPTELMGTKAAPKSLVQMSKGKRDISDRSIDPWVYDFAYDNVNPQNMPRSGAAPKSDVYWKDIYANNKYGMVPTELEGTEGQKFETPPASMVQRE